MSNFDESKVNRDKGKFANKDASLSEAGQVDLGSREEDQARALSAYLNGRNASASSWSNSISGALDSGSKKSLKSWMQNHDVVETMQAKPRNGKWAGWEPGPRELDLSAETYATLDGSRRDYAGVTSIAATDDVWVGHDKDMDTTIVYRAL